MGGVFFASVGTTATTAFWETPQPGKTILIVLGSFLAFATAVTGYFKFRERAYNLQQTADQVEQHAMAFDLALRHTRMRTRRSTWKGSRRT